MCYENMKGESQRGN